MEKGEYGPLKHWGWTCSTWLRWDHCSLPIVWPSTWVSSFSLSNLFPHIIMTQRRVITLQTPFGWILMRDLNHSEKWEPSAWLVLDVGEWETSHWAWPVLCPEGLYMSWRPLYLSRHMHEGFSNIKVGWWSGALQGIVAFSKGKFRQFEQLQADNGFIFVPSPLSLSFFITSFPTLYLGVLGLKGGS